MDSEQNQINYLSLISIFKNEAHVIVEWIEHYLNEGVDHFYLIDNGSTDDYAQRINTYINKGLITLIVDDTRWAQTELYNKHFLSSKGHSEWLIICDLDEFIYARNGFNTIKEYLKSKSKWIGQVHIPWKMFGSSGFIEQPQSVISSFVKRSLYKSKINPGMNNTKKSLNKVIVRAKFVRKFAIHNSQTKLWCIAVRSDDKLILRPGAFTKVSEDILTKSYLHLNHYAIQSRNWFYEIKCTRGDVANKNYDRVRDEEYFKKFDTNDIVDDELANKPYI